jgi:hypothetical protein
MNPAMPRGSALLVTLLAAVAPFLSACGPDATLPPVRIAQVPIVEDTGRFVPEPIGAAFDDAPWISNVTIVDLDQDGLPDILACDDKLEAVVWLRQVSPGKFKESVLMDHLPSPVHIKAVDMNHTGHLDLLVACMGEIFPNNDKIGSIIIGENDGHQHFTKHVIADHIARVTDVEAGDFTGDGRMDLAVGQFGYDQGEIRWMKNLGNWKFESHILLSLSGTINVCVADMTGHGHQDIVAIVSQQWQEIYLFENDGSGNFTNKVIYGSTNQEYGSSGISLCDLNGDGRPDILYTNGDGFGASNLPSGRPWHGVQWLENLGNGFFKYHRIGDLPGAYSPVGLSVNGDGVMDIVALSGFNDWTNPRSVSLVMFKNDGHMNFTEHVLGRLPNHLITCAAGDLDGTGRPSIVTAGFYAYPPFDHLARITLWRQQPKP